MKTVTINIPDDCEVKIVKKKEKNPIIRTYQDLIDNSVKITGYYMSGGEIYDYDINCACDDNVDVALSKKVVKSMRAMAMISQLMPFYGKEITDEEWETRILPKFVIRKNQNRICSDINYTVYCFLAFHTSDQRDDFLKYNEQLVKDYLMID